MKKFDWIFAFKRLTTKKISSLCLLFSFSIILVVFGLVGHFINEVPKIIEYEQIESFNGYDVTLKTDTGSVDRFFEIDKIPSNDKIKSTAVFYKYSAICEMKETKIFNFYAGRIDDIKKMVDVKSESIAANEVIINRTTAKEYNLKKGEKLSFHSTSGLTDYYIIEIVEDQSIIKSTESVIFGIDAILDLEDLGIDNPEKCANVIYYDLFDENDAKDVVTFLNNSDYINGGSFGAKRCINVTSLNTQKSLYIANISILSSFVILTVILLLNSLIRRYISSFKQEDKTIELMGGTRIYCLKIHFIGLAILAFIALFFCLIFGYIFVKIGTELLASNYFVELNHWFFIGIIVGIIALILITIFNFYKFLHYRETKDFKPYFILPIAIIVSIISFILMKQNNKIVAIIFYISFLTLLFYLYKTFIYFIRIRSKSLFSLFNLSYIKKKTIYRNSLSIVFIAFIAIVLVYTLGNSTKNKFSEINKEFNFKYIIYDVDQKIDFSSYEEDEYTKTYVSMGGSLKDVESMSYIVSMDVNKLNEYFNYHFDEKVINKMDNTDELYILLPERYKELYGIEAEDKVGIRLNSKYDDLEAEVIGFFPHEFNVIGITNFLNCSSYEVTPNTVIMKDVKTDNLVANLMIDIDDIFEREMGKYFPLIDFLFSFVVFVVFLLMIVIINNSIIFFEEVKKDYSYLQVIGLSNRQTINILLKEMLFIFMVLMPLVVVGSLIMIDNINYLTIVFDTYVKLDVNFMDVIISILMCMGIYLISQIMLIFKLTRLNLFSDLQNKE